MPNVVDAWSRTAALISDYRSVDGGEKFVGFIPKDGTDLAYVNPSDPHGRVMLNVKRLSSPSLPATLAHELTHLERVSGFETHSGAGTQDNFYLSANKLGYLVSGQVNNFSVKQEGTSEALMNGNLSPGYFHATRSIDSQFIKEVTALSHAPSKVVDIGSAIHEFNINPGISSVMASRNADSIVFAASSFHQARGRLLLGQSRSGN